MFRPGTDGDDYIVGSDYENDWFRGSPGADELQGRGHKAFGDTIDYTSSRQGVNVDLNDQDDVFEATLGVVVNVSAGFAEGDQLEGFENVVGSSYNDNIVGDRGANKLFGGLGNDFVFGHVGDDRIWGDYDGGSHHLDGRHFEDVSNGGNDPRLWGGPGNDTIEGGMGADVIAGGHFDLIGNHVDVDADGNDYLDTASYARSNLGVTVDLGQKNGAGAVTPTGGHATGDELYGFENLHGSVHADMLTGDDEANHIRGSGFVFATGAARAAGSAFPFSHAYQDANDHDMLMGGAGNDMLEGVRGNDTLVGGMGDDTLWGGKGDDNLQGEEGGDHLAGDLGHDTLDGGAGGDYIDGDGGRGTAGRHSTFHDEASYEKSNAGVTVDLSSADATGLVTPSGGHADGDRLYNIEDLRGSAHADMLTGDNRANRIWGEGGDDTLSGLAGNDTIGGGAGADMIVGGPGTVVAGHTDDDMLTGGMGDDTIRGGYGDDEVDGNSGADDIMGGAGADMLYGAGGMDTIDGGAGDDMINGGADRDMLHGEDGDDVIMGKAGDDVLTGDDGYDELWGGAGDDMLTGGHGGDAFVFDMRDDPNGWGRDTITDFANGSDFIVVIDAAGNALKAIEVQTVLDHRIPASGGIVLDFSAHPGGGQVVLTRYSLSDDLEVSSGLLDFEF